MIEQSELEGTFKSHLIGSHLLYQGYLQLGQVAQSHSQTDLEYLWRSGIHHLSQQSVPVFHHPHEEKIFPLYESEIIELIKC